MDTKLVVIISILLLVGIVVVSFVISYNALASKNSLSGDYDSDMPEECKPPQGQDVNAWKEHLGHHENTRYCLEYYK